MPFSFFHSAHKGLQRFEALEHSDWLSPGQAVRGVAPRQRFLYIHIVNKKVSWVNMRWRFEVWPLSSDLIFLLFLSLCWQVTLYTYNWSVDMGSSLNQGFGRLVHWQNTRAHVVNCLLSQKMGLFHHYCFSDTPAHEDLKQVSTHTHKTGPH